MVAAFSVFPEHFLDIICYDTYRELQAFCLSICSLESWDFVFITFVSPTPGRVSPWCGRNIQWIISWIESRYSKELSCHWGWNIHSLWCWSLVLRWQLLFGISMCLLCANSALPLECWSILLIAELPVVTVCCFLMCQSQFKMKCKGCS